MLLIIGTLIASISLRNNNIEVTSMKYLSILTTLFIILISSHSYSQSIRIVRTDVDSTRSDFITASYIFGFDIYLDDVENTNNVSFELVYDYNNFIKYSSYRIGDFGDDGLAFVIPKINPGSQGSLKVGIFSGKPLGEDSFTNPKVLHLEFALLQSAPNGEVATFTFVNALTTAIVDSVPQSLQLDSEPIQFTMHGFVNAWPGDADNNGIVDPRDFNQVALYIGTGSRTKNMRSFKRQSPSTLWGPQRVLVWDDADASYADCNGNGDVTVSDGLVVMMNMDSNSTSVNRTGNQVQSADPIIKSFSTPTSISIPIYADYFRNYKAAIGRIDYSSLVDNYDILGVDIGELFDNSQQFILIDNDKESSTLEFSLGCFETGFHVSSPGNIAYLIVEPKNSFSQLPELSQIKLKGLDLNNRLFGMNAITSDVIDELRKGDVVVQNDNGMITVSFRNASEYDAFGIFNLNGSLIRRSSLAHGINTFTISTQNFPTGIYYIRLSGKSNSVIPLTVLR